MAIINKTGITNGGTIEAEHVTRTIDALSGVSTDTIIATGSFTGSFRGPLTGTASFATTATSATTAATATLVRLEDPTIDPSDRYIVYTLGLSGNVQLDNVNTLRFNPVTNALRVTGSINLSGSLNVNNSAGATIINSSAYSLYRASGFTSIDWANGAIYDSANNAAIQVDNNTIYDINNSLSIDWQNRQLRDAGEVVAHDYKFRILYDGVGDPIINYSSAEYVQLNAVLSLEIRTTTPAAGSVPTGSIMVSGSGVNVKPYFFTGTTWREISLL
jgi:hypothetical protein